MSSMARTAARERAREQKKGRDKQVATTLADLKAMDTRERVRHHLMAVNTSRHQDPERAAEGLEALRVLQGTCIGTRARMDYGYWVQGVRQIAGVVGVGLGMRLGGLAILRQLIEGGALTDEAMADYRPMATEALSWWLAWEGWCEDVLGLDAAMVMFCHHHEIAAYWIALSDGLEEVKPDALAVRRTRENLDTTWAALIAPEV